jgi:tetratricopeptide (TPR) repeat protein
MQQPTKNKPVFFNACLLSALIAGGLALYLVPLLNAYFYYDDRSAILNNALIKKIDIPVIFNAFNTRFLVGLSFAFNYKWCGLHPWGYRLVNILLHGLNAFLVYLITASTLRLNAQRRPTAFLHLKWAAPFASLLFLCHPIQTEPVNSLTQRFVLMGTLFYLLTIYLYIQYRSQNRTGFIFGSMISAAAAMFCKEFTVTLPVMLVLYEFYFLKQESSRMRWRSLIPFFVIALIVPILLLRTPPEALRVANIADSNGIHHVDITRAKGAVSRKEYFLTELNVLCTYTRLLFFPFNQNFDYDYPISSVMDAKTLLSGIFLIGLLVIAIVTYQSYRIVSFAILWFFIALSVESSFIPIGHVIAEYRLYLASSGFVLLAAFLIYTRPMEVKKLNVLAAVILIAFSALTIQRNQTWKDELTFWSDVVRKSPHKASAFNNRGLDYFGQGKFIEAVSDFDRAIALKPDYAEPYSNRGAIYGQRLHFKQAISDFSKAIELNPQFGAAYYNRAYTYLILRDYNKAREDALKAKELGYNVNPVFFKTLNQTMLKNN